MYRKATAGDEKIVDGRGEFGRDVESGANPHGVDQHPALLVNPEADIHGGVRVGSAQESERRCDGLPTGAFVVVQRAP